MTVVQPSPDN